MTSPEVIDALPNQLLDPVAVCSSSANQILHLLQLFLQLTDARVADPRGPAPLTRALCSRSARPREMTLVLRAPSQARVSPGYSPGARGRSRWPLGVRVQILGSGSTGGREG